MEYLNHLYCYKTSFKNKYIIEKSIALPRFSNMESKSRIACDDMINFYNSLFI